MFLIFWCHIYLFFLCFLWFWCFKKPFLDQQSQRFMLMLSNTLEILAFTLRCLIHFELFYASYTAKVQIHPFANDYPIVPALFVEKILLSTDYSWKACLKPMHLKSGIISGISILFISLIFKSTPMLIPCCFHYCSFVIHFEVGTLWDSNFDFFSFKIHLVILGLLHFIMNFRIGFSISATSRLGFW